MLPQRFDSHRLSAVLPADVSARSCSASEALARACRLGSGPATRPLWQPWAAPRIEWPYGVFHVAEAEVARRACLQLDGSWSLVDAASDAARWRMRLSALRSDLCWWRPLDSQDPWDAGVVKSVAALAGFKPRRPTLLVLPYTEIGTDDLRLLGELEQRSWAMPRAVRLVIAGGPTPPFARSVSG